MSKFVFVVIVALVALQMQQNEAFIIVSKSISAAPSGSSTTAVVPAFDPNALIQGLSNAVTAKIQTVNQLVGGLVQAKTNLKQTLLKNILSTVSSASAALPKPVFITKTVRIPILIKGGAAPATPAAPSVTTTGSATVAQSAGYAYGHRYRH